MTAPSVSRVNVLLEQSVLAERNYKPNRHALDFKPEALFELRNLSLFLKQLIKGAFYIGDAICVK